MTGEQAVKEVIEAADWNARVNLIRHLPENFGTGLLPPIYSEIAARVYVPSLAPDFAYVHWPERYELPPIEAAYLDAHNLTRGFKAVDPKNLAEAICQVPQTLRIFRLLLGLTAQEFAASTRVLSERIGTRSVGSSRIKSLEEGSPTDTKTAEACAIAIDQIMRGELFGPAPTAEVRRKIDKPDTTDGWASVRALAEKGVPLPVFLHQRHYGGAFRQLLDATSSQRGNILEDAVEDLFKENGVPYIRAQPANLDEIVRRFGVTVRPAPDFIVFDELETLRGLLECKAANDGGTARDKAARFRSLRAEAAKLGGIPLFGVLAGLGWSRTMDALGPVIRDTDGRVFTIPTLQEMLSVQPFPSLVGIIRTPRS